MAASAHSPVIIDSSVWVASLDPADPRHAESVACLGAVLAGATPVLAAPFLTADIACETAARLGPPAAARADAMLREFPGLRLHAMSDALFANATATGIARRLPLALALRHALAAEGAAELVSWDPVHVERLGAVPPDQWRRERERP